MEGGHIAVIELELIVKCMVASTLKVVRKGWWSHHCGWVGTTHICYTNDCQLQYWIPDDGYSRYPKHVQILK
jgi:hypothetical protein